MESHEVLMARGVPSQESEAFTRLRSSLDQRALSLQAIREKVGLDKYQQQLDSRGIYSLVSGSQLLRREAVAAVSPQSDSPVTNAERLHPQSRSVSLKNLPSLRHSVSSQSPTHQPLLSIHSDSALLTSAAADVMALEASSSPSVLSAESLSPDNPTPAPCLNSSMSVPLFEHFLVIGVSVETALDVSHQLRQKQSKVSDRIMTRIGSFFAGRSNSMPQDLPQGSTDARVARQRSTSILGRMMTREADSGTPVETETSRDKQPPSSSQRRQSASWNMFSRMRSTASPNQEDASPLNHTDTPDSGTSITNDIDLDDRSCSSKSDEVNNLSVNPYSSPTNPLSCIPDNLSHTHGQSSDQQAVFTSDPEILYRFPQDADPPPSQICGFCLPSGAKLRYMDPSESDNDIVEILYGENHDERSSRCFIFILEDKTMDLSKAHPDDESGVDTGRTYGICVVHPRWLDPSKGESHVNRANRGIINHDGSAGRNIEFEASVCYCFITRFPLFDFFFKVLWNIISYERIVRMEHVSDLTNDRAAYEYCPTSVYDAVLEKLTAINPPRYNETLEFSIAPTVSTVTYIRSAPSTDNPEHVVNAVEWALPPLVHWLSPKIIAWALGLLMCEVKLVIIGADPAIVSCAVIGLTSLLKPLQWVSPMIPIMPLKNIDFLEAPVPIIAGMVVDGDSVAPQCLNSDAITPLSILRLCEDGESVTAVLDLSVKDVYVLRSHSEVLPEMMFPGAEELIESVQNILTKQQPSRSCSSFDDESLGTVRRDNKPNFTVNSEHMQMSRAVQECVGKHIRGLADEAKTVAAEVLRDQMMAVEMRVKASLQRIDNRMRTGSNPTPPALESIASTVLESVEEEHHDALHAESADSESLSATEAQNSISSSMSPLRRVSSSSVRSVDGVDNCPVTRNESAVSMLSADSHGSTVIGGGLEIPIVSLKNYHIDTSGEDQSLFLRRFVSTQMYSAYDQEIMGIMHDMEDVVGHDQDDLISRTQSASRTSVGSHSGPAIISQSNGGKKARSRSLYLTPADHAHCSHDIHSRKRCSSSATSSFSLVTRERRSSSGDNGDALNKS
eukprot:CAMPEP_0185022060 /NCGR_PEP_ID=MMETSP1103-20130426/4783_1 /TAXON_ID=36769 /ORGANISM="Paraphysomonas bandaiensis, Strain Caron Lab Isolate" /LENGTH=1071 /DNA_ID=CAMNT_0027553963 /DNA_START=195 /DNA_END=3410 /DNA_ORIENTATION=+